MIDRAHVACVFGFSCRERSKRAGCAQKGLIVVRFAFRAFVPVAVAAAAALVGCSDDEPGNSTGSGAGTATGSSTATGSGGSGATGGIPTTSSTGGDVGGAGGDTGPGGAGGQGGAAQGGGGQGGLGGQGGTAGAGGQGGSGGAGGGGGAGGAPLADEDNDGWTVADGDCCDSTATCNEPERVNPGAFEYPNNGVNDDCDLASSDTVAPADCSPPALVVPTVAADLVKAMDLCQFTTENPPLKQKKWGVIASSLTLADGSSTPKNLQVGVLGDYGPNVTPRKGATMASLSSGTSRDPGDVGHVYPQNGPQPAQFGSYNAQTQVGIPPGYLAANGGTVPSPATCPDCSDSTCSQAFDSARLRARIRVPTNALSLSYDFKFYSAEFPEFVCQQYNDFFVTLLTSGWVPDPNANPPQQPLPADKNVAIDSLGNAVSVNNAFFEVCYPPLFSPPGACPGGTLELAGTGMGGWGSDLTDGGGTNWLTNDVPILPGETIELEFITWDAGDHKVDSLVLLDKFRWNIDAATLGVHK